MTVQPASLYRAPNALAADYSAFRVGDRLLLTGHSHQAWPDVGFAAHQQAWRDAAALVDDKWERAFAVAARVREGWAGLLGVPAREIALAGNTHDLVVRLLSALPLRDRRRIVTTDGEFHTVRRQVDRLAEEGVRVVKVSSDPAAEIAQRLIDAIDDATAVVIVSAVLFRNAHLVSDLGAVLDVCARHGAELLVDAYHALCAIPFDLGEERLDAAFVVGGGYKYCQLGEGNCFLRVPPGRRLRPIVTGWFSEFGALGESVGEGVAYGDGPDRFAGATYDPTSHYRAAAVFEFFDRRGLTPPLLREVSRHQVALLADGFDALDLPEALLARDRSIPLDATGGFLALRSPRADGWSRALRARGVRTDAREHFLRLGPAPYLSDAQLRDALERLREAARDVDR